MPYGEVEQRANCAMLGRIAKRVRPPLRCTSPRGRTAQFNWIPLPKAADVMELAGLDVDMHGIQTSGQLHPQHHERCVGRHRARRARSTRGPYCEILRQWSTLHPEFAFLAPQVQDRRHRFATEDRAATAWHDIGLHLKKQRRPATSASRCWWAAAWAARRSSARWQAEFVAVAADIGLHRSHRAGLQPLSAAATTLYKARIKILVKAEGQKFFDAGERRVRATFSGRRQRRHRADRAAGRARPHRRQFFVESR